MGFFSKLIGSDCACEKDRWSFDMKTVIGEGGHMYRANRFRVECIDCGKFRGYEYQKLGRFVTEPIE